MIPYLLLWLLAIGFSIGGIRLYRKRVWAGCLLVSSVPALVSAGLLATLLHDFGLPHDDGIAVTTVMRWFMWDDNPTLWRSRAYVTAGVLTAATLLFAATMMVLAWKAKHPQDNKIA